MEDLKAPKGHFEINWPLSTLKMQCSTFALTYILVWPQIKKSWDYLVQGLLHKAKGLWKLLGNSTRLLMLKLLIWRLWGNSSITLHVYIFFLSPFWASAELAVNHSAKRITIFVQESARFAICFDLAYKADFFPLARTWWLKKSTLLKKSTIFFHWLRAIIKGNDIKSFLEY